jgi:8-hydroxy-5-deazaflavin:NADPH oxidoreductase
MAAVEAPRYPTIGLIGAGPVARSLAAVLQRVGYRTVVSSRTPSHSRSQQLQTVSFEEAAGKDVVFFAVLHSASRELALALAPQLEGKLVVDVDNAWLPGHYEAAGLSETITEGRWFANLLPASRVARAFSHIDWNLFDRGLADPHRWGAGYAVDDVDTELELRVIIKDMGFVPVSAGRLDESFSLDAGGALWSRLLTAEDTQAALRPLL